MKSFCSGIAIISLCLCLSESAFAQEDTDYGVYMQTTKKNAVLFRGKRAFNYNLRYNGHCFWNTKEYLPGSVKYNSKLYEDVYLNFDASRGEVLVKSPELLSGIVLVDEFVDYFVIGDSRFERPQASFKKSSPEGFYEVLFDDGTTTIYKKVIKTFTSNTNYNNGAAIGYDDPDYDSSLIYFFQYTAKYYSAKDGVMKKIGKGKARKISGRI